MSDTTMEAALVALASALDGATTLEVLRNSDRPEEVPAGGLVVLRDGAQQDAEATMSPLRYHVEHLAEVVILAATESERDALLADMSAAVIADRTLGGVVEWAEVLPVSMDLADFDGAEGLRGALMPVALHYITTGSPAA
jgi:hypothetical protein